MFSYRLYRFVSWIRYTVPRRFTPAGLLALIALAASGAVGADMDQTVAFQIFAFLLSLLLVSMLAAPFFRGRFTARRILPRFGSVGKPLAYHVVIRNDAKRTHQNLEVIDELVDPRPTRAEFTRARRRLVLGGFRKLRLAAPVPFQPIASGVKPVALPNLREHAEATVRSELIPLRRGALRFAAVIIARPDPLGLFRGFIRTPLPQSVLILPKRYPLPNFTLPGSRTYQRGGVALASAIGESDEFVALRDYRPGDPLRHIHWRSWARHGRPVVKEFQDEFFVRHALILDTFANNEQRSAFEEAVAVAASFEFAHEFTAGFVPTEEHAHAAADRARVAHDQFLQCAEGLRSAGLHGGEGFQRLFGLAEAASRRDADGLRSDEQQVEQGLLCPDRAGERRGDGHGFFKDRPLFVVRERVENQRVADEELVLEFLHDGTSMPRPAPPMNVP